jgi:hypothetical protein
MKTSSISQIIVFCGLALGIMALWVSTAPIGINGDQVIGGWYSYTTNPPESDKIGCTSSSGCSACSGITYVYCYNGPVDKGWSCHGGGFYAAVAGVGATGHGTGSKALCDGPYGDWDKSQYCEVDLENAACY